MDESAHGQPEIDQIDEVVGSLAKLEGLPVHDHVAWFETAHERLRDLLAGASGPANETTGT